MLRRAGLLPSRRDERGAIAIVVALVTCFVLIPLSGFAVDIGVQRVARRDAQAVADAVALDLSRQLDGRTYGQIQPTLQALATKSAARNAGGVGKGQVVKAQLGTVTNANWKSDPTHYFTATTVSSVVPNAVKVTVTRKVGFSLSGGDGGVARSAVSTTQNQACYRVGSFALNLDSSKSALLNSLINGSLHLSAISYQGLSNANVTLGTLAAQLGAGSVDGLLNLNNLSLSDLYLASAKALQASGGETADVTLLNQLATANIGALPHIRFTDMIALDQGNNSALATTINLLDVVAGSALVANGSNALSVPSLTAGVPNITGITTSLKIIEKPFENCSSSSQSTSQVSLAITANVATLPLLVFQAATTIKFNLAIASATATRSKVVCGNPVGMDVTLNTGLASLSVVPDIYLSLLGVPIVEVTGTTGTNASPNTQTVQFRHPPDAFDTAKSVGSNAILPTLTTSSLTPTLLPGKSLPLGVTLSGISSAVLTTITNPIINPLINNVNSVLLTPLTSLLGVKLGGADVYFPTQTISCTNPMLTR